MALNISKAKSEMRFFSIASVVLLAIVIAVPSRFWAALISLPLVVTVWLLLFHGTTWISLRLQGRQRKAFPSRSRTCRTGGSIALLHPPHAETYRGGHAGADAQRLVSAPYSDHRLCELVRRRSTGP